MPHRIAVAILILCAAVLTFTRLDNAAYWDDEAHVGVFARNFLQFHNASAWDGRNLVPDHNAGGYDKDLVNSQPQLDNYIVAVSFKLFGQSPWAGRFPFAFFGICSLVLFYFLLRREFPNQPALQLYILAACAFSVNLFLYFRNSRYYGFSVLVTVGIFYAYRRFLETKQWRFPLLLGLLAGLLSLNSILNCACVLAALSARHFIFHRKEITSLKDWGKVAASAVVAGAFAIPYALAFILPTMALTKQYNASMGIEDSHDFQAITLLWWNITGINLINAIPWVIALVFFGFVIWTFASKRKRAKELQPVSKHLLEFAAAIGGYVLLLSLISPQQVQHTAIADVRYLTPILPLMAIIVGGAVWFIDRFFRPAAILVLVLALSSNLLAFAPGNKVQWILPEYVHEITHPYPTGCSEAVAYLREHAKQDDTVWFTPDFMGKPLVFYIGDKMKIRGILDDRTILPKEGIAKMDPQMFIERVYPDWIVAFGAQPDLNQTVQRFSREHTEGDRRVAYRYDLATRLNVYWSQTQRPELPWHLFRPQENFSQPEGVFILKRSEASSH